MICRLVFALTLSTAESVVSNVIPKSQEAIVGDTVVFSCLSVKLARWTYRNERLPANAFTSKNDLIIADIIPSNDGFYECNGISDGKYFDDKVELYVIEEDNSRIHPSEDFAKEGDDVKFSCQSVLSITWQHNFNSIPDNAYIVHNSLHIKKVKNYNEGLYECKGWTETRKHFVARARLVVNADEGVSPKVSSVEKGEVGVLNCLSDSLAIWKFRGRSIPPNQIVIPGENTLTIPEFSHGAEGLYECTGERNSLTFKDKGLLRILISDQNRIYPKLVKVEMGQQAKFKCISSTATEWHYNGRDMPVIETFQFNTITIYPVKLEHAGTYQCTGQTVERQYFTATATLVVFVHDNSKIEPSALYLMENEDGYFSCESSSLPRWFYDKGPDKKIPDGVREDENGNLLFEARKDISGEYTCEGNTEVGIPFIATTTLTVQPVPVQANERIRPHYQRVQSAKDAYFSCQSASTVSWRKDGALLPLNALVLQHNRLLIKKAIEISEGIYNCKGTLEDGTEFLAQGRLEIEMTTEVSVTPKEQTVLVSHDAGFLCKPKDYTSWSFYDGPLPYNVLVQKLDEESSSLEIFGATHANSGSYKCTNTRTGKSDSGDLRVIGGPCSPIPGIDDGDVLIKGYWHGDLAFYMCDSNFDLHGSQVRQCLTTNVWSGLPPKCDRHASKASHSINSTNKFIIISSMLKSLQIS